MPLLPKQLAELEHRGPANVRDLLRNSGSGQGACIRLGTRDGDPLRSDIEAWLYEKDRERDGRDAARYAELLLWGKIAGVAAIIGALAAVVAAVRWW